MGNISPSILGIWINNKHYLVNLNEKNISMLNLRKEETLKRNTLVVNIFLAYSLISSSGFSSFTFIILAQLLDIEMAAIYFMITTTVSSI